MYKPHLITNTWTPVVYLHNITIPYIIAGSPRLYLNQKILNKCLKINFSGFIFEDNEFQRTVSLCSLLLFKLPVFKLHNLEEILYQIAQSWRNFVLIALNRVIFLTQLHLLYTKVTHQASIDRLQAHMPYIPLTPINIHDISVCMCSIFVEMLSQRMYFRRGRLLWIIQNTL